MNWEPPECETLQQQAALMHELWTSFINEGFTRHEASHLILGQPMCCQPDAPA